MGMGAFDPAATERDARLPNKVMRARPDWNRQGPFISKRFKDALHNMDPTLVLQFFPHGHMPHTNVYGFWAVCKRMPVTGYLFKLTVFQLADPLTGHYKPPNMGLIQELRRTRHMTQHKGMEAVYRDIDEGLAQQEREQELDEYNELVGTIDQSIIDMDPSQRDLNICRESVPGQRDVIAAKKPTSVPG